ncbi:MAG TPA: ABC transporter permease subunit [Gammaproteobacteria bacterium]|nr:ABC transporter permease subunit [Gammaproteobacteria bacterium]
MGPVWVIARRELHSMFLSPLAWVVLAVVQFIMAWVFLVQVDTFSLMQQQYLMFQQRAPGVGDLIVAPLLSTASVVMLLVVPLLTMRLIAEEKRSGTITLLRAAPVGSAGIVLGKYLAILLFLALLVAMIALMPASLAAGTDPDWGRLAAGVLGLFLMVAAFAAAGLFMSTVTRQPVVAAIATFGILLLLFLLNAASQGDDKLMNWLSLLSHYQAMLRGSFATGDVIYYLVVMIAFLAFSVRKLDAERLQR